MVKKGYSFGTFQSVFVPSILNSSSRKLMRLLCLILAIPPLISLADHPVDTADVDSVKIIPMLENEIFHLRRRELDVETRIERLKIDIQAVEKRWQTSRESDTERRLLVDSITSTQLKTKVLWEQLNTYRNDLENASLLREWYQKQRLILRSLLSAVRASEDQIDLWKDVIDSTKPFQAQINEECRWRSERLAETRFELTALDTVMNDTALSAEDRRLFHKRKNYLAGKISSDSVVAAYGAHLDSLCQETNRADQDFPLQRDRPGGA